MKMISTLRALLATALLAIGFVTASSHLNAASTTPGGNDQGNWTPGGNDQGNW